MHTQTRTHTYHNTYPSQYNVDLHSQQRAVEQDQQAGQAVAQLSHTDPVLCVLGKLDGLCDKCQDPINKQSCGQIEHKQ